MKCFSEEEQEELDKISESMPEFDPDRSKREQELITKLKEPDTDEDTTNRIRGASTAYQQYDDFAFKESEESKELEGSIYRRSTKRVMSTMAALGMFASSCLGSGKRKPYVADYERVNIKGEPGTYNKSKHLSRAQRKRLKQKSLKKKS